MIETQTTINNWADSTFGYTEQFTAINRMLEEVEELKAWAKYNYGPDHKDFDTVSDECADILITLYRIADVFNFDLHSRVDHKMSINRARKWKSNGNGTGQHVEETK